MSEPFVGEITMFAGSFAPRGWALCDGQLLQINQNDALFSLLGTIYGGDGRTTFGLPDLRGRVPVHWGQGPGLTSRPLGQKSGAENVTLTANQVAAHAHETQGSADFGADSTPAGNLHGTGAGANLYTTGATSLETMGSDTVSSTGGSQQHANVMPFQCLNFIIALVGIYPSRS